MSAESKDRDPPASERGTWRQTLIIAAIVAAMFGVFVFDIYTPPDDVSICFIYAVLVALSGFTHARATYPSAALGSLLSIVGAFIQQPQNELLIVFFGNRAIAVVAQWLVAFLIVTRRHAELRALANYEEEKANAETSRRFVDVLTHEVGTSLTTIDGHAFRLKRLLSNIPEDAIQRLEKIRAAAKHIEGVLRQVQLAFELRQGQENADFVSVDLSNIIREVVLAVAAQHPVNVDTAGLPLVHGNAPMLRQVVENLLSNAVKYSQADTPISIWGRTDGDMVVVSISDRGRGIPAAELSELFKPYFRGSNSRGVHGTGIGLYVVQQYLTIHRGTIDVSSELGAWTTATFALRRGSPPP